MVNPSSIFAFLDGLGGPEMLVIFVMSLMLFGGKKLPELARSVGKAVREFKRAAAGVEDEIRRAMDTESPPPRPKPPAAAALPAAAPLTDAAKAPETDAYHDAYQHEDHYHVEYHYDHEADHKVAAGHDVLDAPKVDEEFEANGPASEPDDESDSPPPAKKKA